MLRAKRACVCLPTKRSGPSTCGRAVAAALSGDVRGYDTDDNSLVVVTSLLQPQQF